MHHVVLPNTLVTSVTGHIPISLSNNTTSTLMSDFWFFYSVFSSSKFKDTLNFTICRFWRASLIVFDFWWHTNIEKFQSICIYTNGFIFYEGNANSTWEVNYFRIIHISPNHRIHRIGNVEKPKHEKHVDEIIEKSQKDSSALLYGMRYGTKTQLLLNYHFEFETRVTSTCNYAQTSIGYHRWMSSTNFLYFYAKNKNNRKNILCPYVCNRIYLVVYDWTD